MKKFLFVVCNNGFGHIKRVDSVVSKLYEFSDDIRVTIVTGDNQYEYLASQGNIERFGLQVLTEPFRFVGSPNQDYKNTFKWMDGLPEGLFENHLVVSDNYICILNRCNAILMGSFLWPDVYRESDDPEIMKYVSEDTETLLNQMPTILCNRYFYMKNLDQLTKPVKLPFFCEDYPGRFNSFEERSSILITSGAGEVDRSQLFRLIHYFVNSKIVVFLDKLLFALYGANTDSSYIRLFGFSSEDFSKLRLVIGRPGIGLVTDCCQFGVPILALNLDRNLEISHNGGMISSLGLGRSFTDIDSSMEQGLAIYSNRETWNSFHNNILLMEMNGHAKAAEYLWRLN